MKSTSECLSLLRGCLETSKPSMFALVHIKEELQDLFGCNVDIIRLREQMDSLLRNRIEKEGIYV